MDWGLAKVLPPGRRRPTRRGAAGPADGETVDRARCAAARTPTQSQAGSVLGTPAYMAPEQARRRGRPARRAGRRLRLGSILCEILTGQPAFTGRDRRRGPPQGGARRPGRRPGPARRLRGRRRAGRPGAGLPGRRAARTGRATPAWSPTRLTAYLAACRSGSGAAERRARRRGRGRGGRRAGEEARGERRRAPGRPGRLAAGPDDRRRPGLHPYLHQRQARAARSSWRWPRPRCCATRPGAARRPRPLAGGCGRRSRPSSGPRRRRQRSGPAPARRLRRGPAGSPPRAATAGC